MKNLKELRTELVGKEMDFAQLDNVMMEHGFLSEASSGVWESCLQDGNIVYTEIDEPTVQIFFETAIPNAEDEIAEAAIVRVTEVESF